MSEAVRVLLRRPISTWLPLAFAVVAAAYGGIVAVATTWGEPSTSIWASSGWVLQWFGFAGGIALAFYLPTLVAHGLTRRRLALASTAAVLVIATTAALLMQVGLVLEWLAFRAGGLEYVIAGDHLFTGVGQVHLVLAEYGSMFAGFLATGALVWTAYYRLGWWRGTLALPLGFVPAVGVLAAQSAGYAGPVDPDSPAWVATIEAPVAAALALLAVVAGLVAFRLFTRTIPVK